ncbi:hypothetical protein [Streptomyces apocyni]|uniref:hypothetical protein n=1 Tax=Streptomyces apocyni TaxID=2654677 RepID=UPI0012EA3526|nr:hypothetical protein [Streptomyces apocyni]
MALRIRRYWRPAVAAAVASTLIGPISVAEVRSGRRAATCRSARDPDLAARMSHDIRAALSFRGLSPRGTAPLDPPDDRGDLWCAPHDRGRLGTASVARVLIVETLLRYAEELRRWLVRFRTRGIPPMIMASDGPVTVRPYSR